MNLDALTEEIGQFADANRLTLFMSYARTIEHQNVIEWDSARHPDFKAFLQVADQLGAKPVCFHHLELSAARIEDVLESLEETELPYDDRREYETRLHDLRGYDGFTCEVELSFDWQGSVYLYNVRTRWYQEFLDIVDDIDELIEVGSMTGEDDGSLGNYFSRN